MSVETANRQKQPLLIQAAIAGNEGAVRLLLDRGAQINARDEGGTTALQWAEWEKDRTIAKGATKKDTVELDAVIALLKAHGAKE